MRVVPQLAGIFNLMQLHGLLLSAECCAGAIYFNLMQPTWATMCQKASSFNLMQSHGLRLLGLDDDMLDVSILCSHTDCDSNNVQRLHFVYNIALYTLLLLMM